MTFVGLATLRLKGLRFDIFKILKINFYLLWLKTCLKLEYNVFIIDSNVQGTYWCPKKYIAAKAVAGICVLTKNG